MSSGSNLTGTQAVVVFVAVIVVAIGAFFISANELSEEKATEVAMDTGLTSVEVGPIQPTMMDWSCGKGDTVLRKVTGINSQGERITVTLCGGLFKGITPRY